ncbi:MAG: patatin-like phospholipase family protein [Bacteroidetes bacterium]|nr:patatin-like phospholipase family protein [Bacteroidota bacterium]
MKQKVTLVLSGGGARGIAHIGVIEALEKQGFEIVSICGTSMGALVGGIYALGKLDEFKAWLFTLDKIKVFKLVDFSFTSQGLIKGDRVIKTLKEFIPDKNIEALPLLYAAVAVDLLKKEEVIFTKGSIFDAIRASISIPTVFTPVSLGSTLLIDGGILNNIPVNHALRSVGDLLIAVNVNADIPIYKPKLLKKEIVATESVYMKKIKAFQQQLYKNHPEPEIHNEKLGYFNLISKTLNLMTEHIAQANLEKYPPDIMINISRYSCEMFDFYKAEELVEIGRHAAEMVIRK